MVSILMGAPGRAELNLATYVEFERNRCSMTSTATGVGVSRIDIEPVATELLACASSVGLRPSQPLIGEAAWPMPISVCDLRAVSLPESLVLRASSTDHATCGRWQVTQAVLPEAESCGSVNRSRPSSTSALFSIGRAGARRYWSFSAWAMVGGVCAPAMSAPPTQPATIKAVRTL